MSREKPFVHRVKPVWRDMDALRHVNNAVYLTYLENTRDAYWHALGGEYGLFPFTLARIEIDYRSAATWRDELSISAWIEKIGKSSFELAYTIDAADGRRCAEAKSVLVMMNADHTKPERISDALRSRLQKFEASPGA